MGVTNNICWKLYHYGVKRDHYDKLIIIRELLEQLALDCFNNPFSTDTGTLAKNIPPLDEAYEGEIFSTCRALEIYSYIPPSTAARTFPT